MQVIITNLAWIRLEDLDQVALHILRNDLTIVPKSTSRFNPNPDPIRLYAMTDKFIGVPRAYYLRKKSQLGAFRNVQEDWRVSEGTPLSDTSPITSFTLRPDDQVPSVDAMVKGLQSQYYGCLEAYTAFGKSLCSAEIVRLLGRNTLFLMHRSSLIDQWRRNLEKYKPNWSLGEIKAGVCDYKGKDIVFATFQSLMGDHGDKYPEEMWSYFGTICVDEMHVASAEKFGSVAPKFSAKYMLGVSGTIRRLDKTEACFEAVLGHIIHKADEKYRVRPKIFARNTNCDFRVSNDLDKVQLVSLLSSSVKRNTLIANDAFKAFKAGRFPVVMAERKEILEKVSACVASIAEKENISVANGFYIGGKSEAELLKALQSDIVYATVQMMKEGIDHPRLDTLLLATPMSDVEQCCGRVTRRVDGKKEPMVVDYVDCAIPKFKGSFLNRYKMYKKLGWEVLGLERLEL